MTWRTSTTLVNVAVFIILEVASLCLLAGSTSQRRLWLESISNDLHGFFWKGLTSIGEYMSLEKENERLLAENALLMNGLINAGEKNSVDSTMWDRGRVAFVTTPAKVVSMSHGSQHNYLILDRGRRDGVSRDDGVITSTGIIGIVHSVGERFCYVRSFMNQDMVISAKVGHNGYVGIMQWDGLRTGESALGSIPIHITAHPGDTVYTSGFSAIFPPDLPIGILTDKRSDDGSATAITVKLFDDYAKTYNVMIVKNLDRQEIRSLSE